MPIIQIAVLSVTAIMEGILTSFNHKGVCLRNTPTSQNILLEQCGNKVAEGKEECDCGSECHCRKGPCCGSKCKLKPWAHCAFGPCFMKIKFASPGMLRRAHISECDLPDWYNGSSRWSPEGFHVQEGMPCGDTAYCYHKRATVTINGVNIFLAKQQGVSPEMLQNK